MRQPYGLRATRLFHFAAGFHLAVDGDDAELAVEVLGREYHTLAFDAAQLAGRQIGDEAHLTAHKVFGGVVFGYARHDGAVVEAVGNGEHGCRVSQSLQIECRL